MTDNTTRYAQMVADIENDIENVRQALTLLQTVNVKAGMTDADLYDIVGAMGRYLAILEKKRVEGIHFRDRQ